MKNTYKILMVTVILLIITIGVLIVVNTSEKNKELGVKLNVTATFYPQYIALMNIMDGAKNVKYDILNSQNVGCLHHYSITTADMKKLENSDVIVLNGAGMEEKIIDYINGINKKLIDSSEQITTLQDGNEVNAHTFLSIKNYIKQVENIRDGLVNIDKENSEIYKINASEYIKKLESLDTYANEKFKNVFNNKIVTGHTTFNYFAKEYNLEVVLTLEGNEEEKPSAKELQEKIDNIKARKVRAIFVENSSSSQIANTVSNETNLHVFTLNDITNGKLDKNGYIDAMKKNIDNIWEGLNAK